MKKLTKKDLRDFDFADYIADEIRNHYENDKHPTGMSKKLKSLVPIIRGWDNRLSSQYGLTEMTVNVTDKEYKTARLLSEESGKSIEKVMRDSAIDVAKNGLSDKQVKVIKKHKRENN